MISVSKIILHNYFKNTIVFYKEMSYRKFNVKQKLSNLRAIYNLKLKSL